MELLWVDPRDPNYDSDREEAAEVEEQDNQAQHHRAGVDREGGREGCGASHAGVLQE